MSHYMHESLKKMMDSDASIDDLYSLIAATSKMQSSDHARHVSAVMALQLFMARVKPENHPDNVLSNKKERDRCTKTIIEIFGKE